MNLFDAEILAKELISQHVPYYQFCWNNLKTVNGRCSYTKKTIYLSRHLTHLRTKESVRTTIMHEIAHALTPKAGHGKAWKAQMRAFGLSDARCSSDKVDRSSIANWRAVCVGCAKVSYMIRKPRVERSCGVCSGGSFNTDYVLNYVRMS